MPILYLKKLYSREDEASFLPVRSVKFGVFELLGKGVDVIDKGLDLLNKGVDQSIKIIDQTFNTTGQLYDAILDRVHKDPVPFPGVDTQGVSPNNPGTLSKDVSKAKEVLDNWGSKYQENIDIITPVYDGLNKINTKVTSLNDRRSERISQKESFLKDKRRERDVLNVGNFGKIERIESSKNMINTSRVELEKRLIWRAQMKARGEDTQIIDGEIRGIVTRARRVRDRLDKWNQDESVASVKKINGDIMNTEKELKDLREKKASFRMNELNYNDEDGNLAGNYGEDFLDAMVELDLIDQSDRDMLLVNVPIEDFINKFIKPNLEKVGKRKTWLEDQRDACVYKKNLLSQATLNLEATNTSATTNAKHPKKKKD